jgi:hypothetical protein
MAMSPQVRACTTGPQRQPSLQQRSSACQVRVLHLRALPADALANAAAVPAREALCAPCPAPPLTAAVRCLQGQRHGVADQLLLLLQLLRLETPAELAGGVQGGRWQQRLWQTP